MKIHEKINDRAESRPGKPEETPAGHPAKAATDNTGLPQFLRIPDSLRGLFLIVAVILAYLPLWHAGFIWDDDTFLINNPLIRQFNGLYQFWFTTKATDYFPLTFTTLWLEWRLWGANPLGYHIVNMLLHAFGAVLIWRVLAHLKMPGAWLAAALFAVHPVNVESVAWITERKNTLSMLFYVSTILFYLRFEDTDRRRWYAAALVSFALALLSKTAVAPLPVVLLGLAWWRRDKISRLDIRRTLPFFGLAVLMGLITVWFQSHNAIGPDIVRTDNFWSRLAGAGFAVWFYLYKALIPVNLVFVYPKWQIDPASLLSYMPGLLLLAAALLFWRYRRGWGKAWLLAMGYFVVMLLPVLGFWDIYFMRYSLVADRWQYFSIIAPLALVAAGLSRISRRLKQNYYPALLFIAVLLLTLGVLTWRLAGYYRDNGAIWQMTIAGNPSCWMAHNNLGLFLKEKGYFDEAITHYQQAVLLNPDYADAYSNRGNVYNTLGQYQRAIEDYNEAIRLKPGEAVFYHNRGGVYYTLGQYQPAIDDFGRAVRLEPHFSLAYYNRGIVYSSLNRYSEALDDFNEAIRLKNNYADAYNQRAHIYFMQGLYENGCADAQKACELGKCGLLETAKGKGHCR